MASRSGIDIQVTDKNIVRTGAQAIALRESPWFLLESRDAEDICDFSEEYKKRRADLKAKSKIFKRGTVSSIMLKFSDPVKWVFHVIMEKLEGGTQQHWFENMQSTFNSMLKKADKKGVTSVACSLFDSGIENENASDVISAIVGAIVTFKPKNLNTLFIVSTDKDVSAMIQKRHSILLQSLPESNTTGINQGAGFWIRNMFQKLVAAKAQKKVNKQDDMFFEKRSMSTNDLDIRPESLKRNSSRRVKVKKPLPDPSSKEDFRLSDNDIHSYHSEEDVRTVYCQPDETELKEEYERPHQISIDHEWIVVEQHRELSNSLEARNCGSSKPGRIIQDCNEKHISSRNTGHISEHKKQGEAVKRSTPLPSIQSKINKYESIIQGNNEAITQKLKPSLNSKINASQTLDTNAVKPERKRSFSSKDVLPVADNNSATSSEIFGSGRETAMVEVVPCIPQNVNAEQNTERMNTCREINFTQLRKLFRQETRFLIMKRDDVVEPLLDIYREEEIIDGHIAVTFEEEIANKEVNLTNEMFTTFWNDVTQRYWKGEDATVPSMNLGRFRKEKWKYECMGRILSHTAATTLSLPCRVARSALIFIMLEEEADNETLLGDLILFVTPCERKILEKALKDFKSLEQEEGEKLVDFFSLYEMGELPKSTEIREQLVIIAKDILVDRPKRFYELIRKGIPEKHHSFWRQLSVQQINTHAESQRPTPAKVIAVLENASRHLKVSEESTLYFLRQFLESQDQDGIIEFLLYVTGSTHLPLRPIRVSFNNLVGEHRRPVAHTCSNTLELSSSYSSVQEFRRELRQVLNSSYSYQYSLKH